MDGLSIDFIYAGAPESSELSDGLTHLLESDCCTTQPNGESTVCSYRLGGVGDRRKKEAEPSTAIEELSEEKEGSARLYLHGSDEFDHIDFSLRFIDDPNEQFHIDTLNQFLLHIHVNNVYLDPMRRSDDELLAYSKRLLSLTKTLYEVTNPIHVVGYRVMPGVEASFFPVPTLEIDDVEIIRPVDWLAIFEPETLDRLGRDWLDDIEFWHREQLDGGAELIALGPLPNGTIDDRLNEIAKHI